MSGLLSRGIASFRAKAKEKEVSQTTRFLFLREDGERARIRFLSDADRDFVHGVFHRPFVGGKLLDPVLCLNDEDNPKLPDLDVTECRLCALGDDTARQMFFAWVYVYYILHPQQNPRLAETPSAQRWEPTKVGMRTMFRQDVGQVRLLLGGKRLLDALINLHEELGGLLETDLMFIRNGARNSTDTTYSFVPTKSAEMPDEKVLAAVERLPDLEDMVLRGTLSYYGKLGAISPVEAFVAPAVEEAVVGADEDEFADI